MREFLRGRHASRTPSNACGRGQLEKQSAAGAGPSWDKISPLLQQGRESEEDECKSRSEPSVM